MILDETPGFTPALHVALDGARPVAGVRGEELAVLARRFAADSPGTQVLAARHLLDLAAAADAAAEWHRSAALYREVLDAPMLRPTDRLMAEDGLGRAESAATVAWEAQPAQPAG